MRRRFLSPSSVQECRASSRPAVAFSAGGDGGRRSPEHPAHVVCGDQRLPWFATLGRLECSFLSHLRQQRLQLISQPNNVLRVLSLPPSSQRIQTKYGGGCPVESLSDIAAEYEFSGALRVVDRVNRSACDAPAVEVGEHCPQVIDGLDSETQRRGFLRLPLGADRGHKAGDRHH